MSLAIAYADKQCNSRKNPRLHQAFHVLRKTQIRLDKLILEHAVVTIIASEPAPLELWYLQSTLKDVFHIDVSRRMIKKFVLKPLCKERCIRLTFGKKSAEEGQQTRLYASTSDLKEYCDVLETEIIVQSFAYA